MSEPIVPPIKQKNRSPLRVIMNAWGCLFGLVMLGLGAAAGLLAATFIAPQLLGLDATATALADQEIMQAATDADIRQRETDAQGFATQQARDNAATSAALNNEAALLDQTATQSARNIAATGTSIAVQSALQRTQIALNYEATQSALQADATQIELDFRNTQAALGEDVTLPATQGGFEAQAATAVPSDTATAVPSDTATAVPSDTPQVVASATPAPTMTYLLPPSDTPSPTATGGRLLVEFQGGLPGGWDVSGEEAWDTTERGLQAAENGAWLRSSVELRGDYRLDVVLAPAVVLESEYFVLVGLHDEGGYAVQMTTLGLASEGFSLLRLDAPLDEALQADALETLETGAFAADLASETHLRLQREGTTLTVSLNEVVVLLANAPQIDGQFGVQFPQGAILLRMEITP